MTNSYAPIDVPVPAFAGPIPPNGVAQAVAPLLGKLERLSTKKQRETAEGCRLRAEADLGKAAAADTDNGRLRFEHSAARWASLGALLFRLETSEAARSARPSA